jgi:hypothetical protein
LSLAEPVVFSEEEKSLDLGPDNIVLRRSIVSGKKDCCWCELHLKCGFERRNYSGLGYYCNQWVLSKTLRDILKIVEVEAKK